MLRGSIAPALVLGAALAFAACSAVSGLDQLTFDATGAGGAATTSTTTSKASSGAGGQTSTSSSGGSGGAGGQASDGGIPCVVQGATTCASGEICCVDPGVPGGACDECASSPDACGTDRAGCAPPADYVDILCHTDQDCPAGKICCVATDGVSVSGIACSGPCDMVSSFPVCDADQDCHGGTTCHAIGYASYGYCN